MVCLPAMESEYIASKVNSFDVEAAINILLADPSRASIELPRELSAEQRKHAKKTVEQHPDLKCESFGMGQDRQMHIFKRKSGESQSYNDSIGDQLSECSPQSVRVKNTFIDDWVHSEVAPADRRNVQSMPHNMFAQCLSAEMSGQISSKVTTNAESTMAEHQYALGSEVVIDGLVKAPQFNGASGVIQSWDAESSRYNILLTVPTAGGQRWAKVKGENIRLAKSPEPISFGSFDD